MHKIMIVDDDRIIRMGLMKTIPWAEHGFELVGEAGDGEQALELIRKTQPQVVISDIRMPFMDGLELARRTRELYPAIKFIFLTGFEDFGYAKTAVGLQAVDYLLKPVERGVLLDKVKKAAAAWDKDHGSREQLQAARPYLKGGFFQKLLAGTNPENEMIREAAHLGLDIDHSYALAMLACIDDYDLEEVHPRSGHRELRRRVADCLDQVIEKEGLIGGTFILEHEAQAVLLMADSPDGLSEMARKAAMVFCQQVRTSLQATLTIGLGTVQAGISGIAASFDDAHSVLAFRHVIGKDTVITTDDLDRLVNQVEHPEKAEAGGEMPEEDLVEKVRLGLVDDALQLLTVMEESLCSRRLSLGEIRLRAVDMLLGLFKGAARWAPAWQAKHAANKAHYYSEINHMQTVSEIMGLLRSLVDSLAQFMIDENSSQRGDVIDEVTDYIEAHYAEHGLSLQDIGRHVHMNPIYLSVLFKKKKKITFTGFLLQIRMTKAMEMLRATDMKTYEVAERTGYSSPEYFGACFKKYTGSSPLEFRNRS